MRFMFTVFTVKTYPFYIHKSTTALTITFNLVTGIEYPSIVRAVRCNYASTGNVKREELRSKRLIKILFRPKITTFHSIIGAISGVSSKVYIVYIRTFEKLHYTWRLVYVKCDIVDKNRKNMKILVKIRSHNLLAKETSATDYTSTDNCMARIFLKHTWIWSFFIFMCMWILDVFFLEKSVNYLRILQRIINFADI